MKDFIIDKELTTSAPILGTQTPGIRDVSPVELARWMEDAGEKLAERWLAEIDTRGGTLTSEMEELLERFLRLLVSLLPTGLGPFYEQVEPLWRQAAELYGSVGAMRGLAAGEIIEEFQLLRETLLRLLEADPPGGAQARISLRETLRLNRIVDQGVTHASVAHTDSLFFALFQGTGVPEALTPQIMQEVQEQLTVMEREHEALLRLLD